MLSEKEKQDLKDTLDRTGKFRDQMVNGKVIPDDYAAWLQKVERVRYELPVPAVNVPVTVYVSSALDKTENCPVHINMHGGGFVFGHGEDDDRYSAHIAAETRGIVVDIDYASAFQYPFPVAFEQCYEAVKWTFSRLKDWNADEKRVSIGGQSAGGNLSAAICTRAAGSKDFRLCMQILDYAALDNYMAVPKETGNDRTRAFSLFYCDGDVRLLKNAYVSPIFATDEMLKDQPGTVIMTAARCPFKKVNEEYASRLARMGNEVTVRCFMNSGHAFTVRLMDEWREGQEYVIRNILESSL